VRSVEWIELGSEVLPRRWLRFLGLAVLLGLLVTGKAADFAQWFVMEKAAALQEQIAPAIERLTDRPGTASPPPQAWTHTG